MATKSITTSKGTLVGTDRDDLLEVWGEQDTVLGQKGNDKIDVCQGSSHRIFGGDGNDTITLLKSVGDSVKVYGDVATKNKNGESVNENKCSIDTIIVNGGSNHVIYGGYFGDTITITSTAGNNIEVNAGSGADKIYVHGGRQHNICGDEGPDTILLTSNLNKFEQAKRVLSKLIVDGGTGQDEITVNGGSGHSIAGGAGPDTITVASTAGNNMVIDGGSGEDTITVNGGTGHSIVGGQARDTITVNGGSGYAIDGGSAADTITLKNVTDSTVVGGSEKDYITVNGGSDVCVYGGSGNDVINLYGVTSPNGGFSEINGDAGNDSITIHETVKGSMFIDGGTGTNTIIISGGNNHWVDCLNGENTVIVKSGTGHNICGSYTTEVGRGFDTIEVYSGKNDISSSADGSKISLFKGVSDGSIIYGNIGKDEIYIESGNHEIHTGGGDDIISINNEANSEATGRGNTIHLGNGNDKVTITGGFYNAIYDNNYNTEELENEEIVETDNDTITINNGSKNYITLEKGNNTVTLNGGSNNSIYIYPYDGLDGNMNNTILLNNGANNTGIKIECGSTTITGGTDTTIEGDYGRKTITINNSNNSKVLLGGGSQLNISGGQNHEIEFVDAVDDIISVKWSNSIGSLTIDNSRAIGENTLKFSNVNSSAFSFSYQNDNLYLTYSLGSTVTIKDWLAEENDYNEYATFNIAFKDKTLLYSQINNNLGIG